MNILINLRNKVSNLLSHIYKKTTWQPPIPSSIEELAKFMKEKTKWVQDPIWGLLDHIQPIDHMNYTLITKGKVEGDCDDLATYAGYMLGRMGYTRIYRVNLITHQHVICIFRDIEEKKYYWISNSNFTGTFYTTLTFAINGYCRWAHPNVGIGTYTAEVL